MENELINEELHKLVAKPDEPFDIEWEEFIWDKIGAEGELVATHDWDSGGPGAGAGCVSIWKFRGVFVVSADDQAFGPFTSFEAAVHGSEFDLMNEATTGIWVHDQELKARTEFPDPSALSVQHSEPVSLTQGQEYSFSKDAMRRIEELVAPSGRSSEEFIRGIAPREGDRHQIIVFLDGLYHAADHIREVRGSIDQIAMTSWINPRELEMLYARPAGVLFVADVPTLAELAERSPFLAQILPIADGQPDDETWAYFLGEVGTKPSVTDDEDTSEPLKKPRHPDGSVRGMLASLERRGLGDGVLAAAYRRGIAEMEAGIPEPRIYVSAVRPKIGPE